jgi:cGMP-dependent protein kinase
MADFGFVKKVLPGERTVTLCGTPEYLAPEVVKSEGHWQAADW